MPRAVKPASRPREQEIARAKKANKAVKQGGNASGIKRVRRTKVHFFRPKTLKLPRNPKVVRKSVSRLPKMDQFRVLKHPLTSESSMKKIEDHNTLTFIVDLQANKNQIKQAVKKMYSVEVAKVNTLVRPDGKKKAYVRLKPDHDALDTASKIGLI
eukprot:EC788070.1.p2 GENE.EC788070.1~~EC788070.1.p2  ORF type:complete len:156 (+),score=64.69 EC788070.1:22-489(+)